MVSGKLPPGKFLPGNCPLIKLPHGKFSPLSENSDPENSLLRNTKRLLKYVFYKTVFPPMFLDIPTGVFKFCVFSLLSPSSLILVKRLFCNFMFQRYWSRKFRDRFIKNISLPAKMVTYSKKFCWSNLIIGHYYNPPVCFGCFFLWSFSRC